MPALRRPAAVQTRPHRGSSDAARDSALHRQSRHGHRTPATGSGRCRPDRPPPQSARSSRHGWHTGGRRRRGADSGIRQRG
ncbi:hypothetical protein G6F65_022995 [Rhizopus arrhizus]|nr:hypothetical protein G6F65_022995 [Rhizopus arrhizus]KAG1477321.1 hypothetical protein G6F53_014302 [Rhizopus delemar]